MVLRRLLFGCLLACGLAKADSTCYTVYINEPIPYVAGPFLTPLIESVKVLLVITGDNITSYHEFPDGTTEVYVNGHETQEFHGHPTCSQVLAGLSRKKTEPRAAASAQSVPAGQANSTVALGDFNGDGVIDSAVLGPSGVTVNLFKSDGTMLATSSYPVSGIGASILSADFNGDGFADLAMTETDSSGQGNVVILLGKGDGTFGTPAKFPAGPYAFYLATGDFNGDGSADLAVTNTPSTSGTANTVSVLLGKGNGSFSSPVSYAVGNFPGTIVAADFNGDSKEDLAALDIATGVANNINRVWVRGTGPSNRRCPLPRGPVAAISPMPI